MKEKRLMEVDRLPHRYFKNNGTLTPTLAGQILPRLAVWPLES